MDDNTVSGSDAGNNFFLTQDSIGQPRAKCVTELLSELNEEVEGNHVEQVDAAFQNVTFAQYIYVPQNPAEIVANNPQFFHQFNLVIATQLPESVVLPLAEICWEANIPLFVVRVNGFFGYFRIALPEHTSKCL